MCLKEREFKENRWSWSSTSIKTTVSYFGPMREDIDAVLFVVFNRIEYTTKVFERIRGARPKRLYIAADGPRDRPGEREACESVRRIVEEIDWECEVHTLFREKNLGCRLAISSAITWFFEHEEMGIILEEDCLPDPTFFSYCQILLERYKNDSRVMMITGSNSIPRRLRIKEDYFFSEYFHIWGWATWRRAWALYDAEMKKWPEMLSSGVIRARYGETLGERIEVMFQSVFSQEIITWDSQWAISCISNNGLCITPRANLISNIGIHGAHFDGGGSRLLLLETRPIHVSDLEPPVKANRELDLLLFDSILDRPNYLLSAIHYRLKLTLMKIAPDIDEHVQIGWILELARKI